MVPDYRLSLRHYGVVSQFWARDVIVVAQSLCSSLLLVAETSHPLWCFLGQTAWVKRVARSVAQDQKHPSYLHWHSDDKSRRPCPETSEASRLSYLECTTRGVIVSVSLVSSHWTMYGWAAASGSWYLLGKQTVRAPNYDPWRLSCPTVLGKARMDGKETACRYLFDCFLWVNPRRKASSIQGVCKLMPVMS